MLTQYAPFLDNPVCQWAPSDLQFPQAFLEDTFYRVSLPSILHSLFSIEFQDHRVSCVQRGDEVIAKGCQHPCVSYTYLPRLVTVTEK